MESLQNCFLKQGLVSVVIVSLSVCSTSVISVAAQVSTSEVTTETSVLLEDQKKEKTTTSVSENSRAATSEEDPFVVSDPSVTVESGEGIDGMTMLYVGGAIGLIAIGAVAMGGGSSSSSDSGPTPNPITTPVVGPNINGANWAGFLDIKNTQAEGYQNVTATIVQSGSSVQITTSSTLLYGQFFNGSINGAGYMKMYDSVTGEDWTTYYKNATATSVDLYDYVNGLKDLDRMLLTR
jgi:hypothetical protein